MQKAGFGHAILVGRGANVIIARLPNVFHVRLVAPLATRVRHAAACYHVSEAEGVKFVRERDRARRRYVRRYFDAKIDDPTLYDATLNTRRFGFDGAAEVIAQLALRHHQLFCRTRTFNHHYPEFGTIRIIVSSFQAKVCEKDSE